MANRERLQSIDVYRGLAILAMVAYHTLWDLTFYRLIETGIGVDPVWISIQRGILTAFLLLAGAGLALAHRDGMRWRGFWKREAILVAASIGVSVVTWFQFGSYFAYFGVLHAIALCSLLALPFVRAPLWAGIGVAVIALFLPTVYSADLFNVRWLAWIGFFTATPETADLVPVFPWLGVVLIGVIGMRLLTDQPAFTWRSSALPVRVLGRIGRWSLIIYLVHQPLLFGLVTPLAHWVESGRNARLEGFLQSCRASCAPNGTAAFCTAYCACALDVTVRDNLWNAAPADLNGMVKLCTAMSK
ncbi:MAG: heparan-alpha-glucosaminide N-acetyltransferase [Devosia sp.]